MIHSSHIFILIISHVLTVNTFSERLILALFRGYSCVKLLLGKGTTLCKNICSKWFINSKIGPNISSFNESMPFTMWSRCFSLPHFLPLESVSAPDLLWQVKCIREVCILLPNVDLKRVWTFFLYSVCHFSFTIETHLSQVWRRREMWRRAKSP